MVAIAATAALSADDPGRDSRVESAIVAAVHARVGGAALVSIRTLDAVRVQPGDAPLVATPEPGGRLGRSLRFTLALSTPSSGGSRVGEAFAIVDVESDVMRAIRPIARGAIIAPGDVERASARLDGLLLRPIPLTSSVVGARATRDLREGDLLTDASVAVLPQVRAGAQVRVTYRTDGLDVSGTAVALETGFEGQVVRVSNPASRRTFRARILGPGEVEVIDGR